MTGTAISRMTTTEGRCGSGAGAAVLGLWGGGVAVAAKASFCQGERQRRLAAAAQGAPVGLWPCSMGCCCVLEGRPLSRARRGMPREALQLAVRSTQFARAVSKLHSRSH